MNRLRSSIRCKIEQGVWLVKTEFHSGRVFPSETPP